MPHTYVRTSCMERLGSGSFVELSGSLASVAGCVPPVLTAKTSAPVTPTMGRISLTIWSAMTRLSCEECRCGAKQLLKPCHQRRRLHIARFTRLPPTRWCDTSIVGTPKQSTKAKSKRGEPRTIQVGTAIGWCSISALTYNSTPALPPTNLSTQEPISPSYS